MKYRIGLDIGIGSVGWAVVSDKEDGHPARIEDFGTRIFESGEKDKGKATICQDRRLARGVRRLERRRAHRKELLLNHFQNIGLVNNTFHDEYAEIKDKDVYVLKVKGIDEKLTPAEIYKCLVHTCNHRGYRDFYEPSEDDEESGLLETAANAFESAFRESGKRTVSEYLLNDFTADGFVKYRNRNGRNADLPHLLIRRSLLEEEASMLLEKQAVFYPCLSKRNTDSALRIIFTQRDFEDGPGNPDDPQRRYHGFLETVGKCPFYKTEDRAFRGSVIADVYAVTNTLSQYRFVNEETGECVLSRDVARQLVDYLLVNAKLTLTDVKRILKANGYTLKKSDRSDDKALGKAIKFMGIAKKSVESAGLSWEEMIKEEQFDPESSSVLDQIGDLISKFQTPRRRRKEMEDAGIDPLLIKAFSEKRISGTAAVSKHYMCDSIEAFLNGETYGDYQARFNKEQAEVQSAEKYLKLPGSCISESEIRDNRVVFRAINETRKIVNAIIERYGSPTDIVVEIANELGKSFEMREEDRKRNDRNKKANDQVKENIADLLHIDVNEVKGGMVERYKLFHEQEGKCAYSGMELGSLEKVLLNSNREYEIDHIVPYSLILDNTLNNKMLVFAKQNQTKGQRTPLEFMSKEQGEAFLANVNRMATRKENPISRKKAEYCRLASVAAPEAQEKLSGWKSRNINDTRYITKYVCGLFEQHLVFAGERKQHVFPVKGAVTQKFRREWFRDSKWGEEEKNRETYLNHALDAVVAANLTKPYIEIGSDALRLIALLKHARGRRTPEYEAYLEDCVTKMQKYYGFAEDYTRNLLSNTQRVPSFVPRLVQEVKARFNDEDAERFAREMKEIYGREAPFVFAPHMPITSIKPDRKFKGCIADANPLRIVEIDGVPHKIKRISIRDLSKKRLDDLRTNDAALRRQLTEIFEQGYSTVDAYLKKNGLSVFKTASGQEIRKISVDGGAISNFYRKEIGENNYTNLGMLKYYCVELYRDTNGALRTCGIRFVDLVKKDKKLCRKAESLPKDYSGHVMYLFPGDYIRIMDRKKVLKFEGYYFSVSNINKSSFYCKSPNKSKSIEKTISSRDYVIKYTISLLGARQGGKKSCSEPFACIGEKKSP